MPVEMDSFRAGRFGWTTALAVAAAALALLCAPGPARGETVAPVIDTAITDGPADASLIEQGSTGFSFSATRDGAPFPDAAFQCSVDDGPFQACTSPLRLERLDEGAHSFSVFAEDPESVDADPEPDHRMFAFFETEEECEEPEAPAGDEEEAEAEAEGGVYEEEPECGEKSRTGPVPPEECLLRTARARVLTFDAKSRVRLVVRYTSFSPADVTVDYGLTGGRGPLKLGAARQRLAGEGVFRVTEKLSRGEMEKVRAARRFTVEIDTPAAPGYCRRFATRELTVRRTVRSQVVWLQSDSAFGT